MSNLSISPEYFRYLDHFRSTVPLRDFAKSEKADLIALRHDVDYSIDVALEMAFWESEHGIHATYFLLHTADYWSDPDLIEKCLQIQAFGHEVGLHLNLIAKWFNDGSSPEHNLRSMLERLRSAGLDIRGMSAHGDKLCYDYGFINYWLFSELRTEDPFARESVRNAEGILRSDFDKSIHYPPSHCLEREDGRTLELWEISMAELGLDYEASHLGYDNYLTDSGGAWMRSADPMTLTLQKGRHQILMHPLYWRGTQKTLFILSAARSGSKWLSKVLEQATSCAVHHERTLNYYEVDGSVHEEKMTGTRLHELLGDNRKIDAALDATASAIDSTDADYIEANVYLPLIVNKLKSTFPEASLLHLHRDPKKVVQSLMNRGWYDTPGDTAHPIVGASPWNELSQMENCCQYVAFTNRTLLNACETRLSFERMTTDMSYLGTVLKGQGVPLYPLLAKRVFDNKINQNVLDHFPGYRQWSIREKAAFGNICGKVSAELDYRIEVGTFWRRFAPKLNNLRYKLKGDAARGEDIRTSLARFTSPEDFLQRIHHPNCNGKVRADCVDIKQAEAEPRHVHVLLNGAAWGKLEKDDWKFSVDSYFVLSMKYHLKKGAHAVVYCLMYDAEKNLFYRRNVGLLHSEKEDFECMFSGQGKARYFNIAIYMPRQKNSQEVSVCDFSLSRISKSKLQNRRKHADIL